MDPLVNAFGPLEGEEIPGGCEECDAFQTVEPVEANLWKLTVHHDPDCPRLARIEGRRRGAS